MLKRIMPLQLRYQRTLHSCFSLGQSTHQKKKKTASQKTLTERAKEEVNGYREVQPVPLSKDPLIWWRDHAGKYPLLALQEKQYLSLPWTRVHSEQVFSTAGDIVTAQRSCMTPQYADQLLFLQSLQEGRR